MKKSALAFLMVFIAASIGFAQTVVIKPKKTVYTRKGKEVPKEKRTFTVTYPLFNGTMSAAAKNNLEKTISYWNVFETTLAENLADDYWLYEMSYEVNYNRNGILDIALTMDGSGAYPDQSTKDFVIDLKTGNRVRFADAFKPGSLPEFAAMVDGKMKAEVKETIQDIDKGDSGSGDKETDKSLKDELNALSFTAETFDEFSVNDKGVTIFYDAGFPHVSQALQPAGRYFFTWAQAKPFIKPDGLLGKFVR